jgi:hypothetical protein
VGELGDELAFEIYSPTLPNTAPSSVWESWAVFGENCRGPTVTKHYWERGLGELGHELAFESMT